MPSPASRLSRSTRARRASCFCCAQLALHDADSARTRVALYVTGRDQEHRRRLTLLTELRIALENDGLQLVYQPKVEMGTRTVKSVEALARWTHPHLGVVSPGEFVPLAEQTGNTRRLTSWVLAAAIRQMAAWRSEGLEIDVAVNLSAADILDTQLGDEVLRTLQNHNVPPTSLLLEITESAVMRDPVLAARNMQLLQVSGVRFAIDDFGTGYSSLSQLSRLPFDELKIDRSLLAHAHERADDATIVASTIELAHRMKLRVVAEGVETSESWNLLRRLGCDLAQGYLVSPPIPPDKIPPFVAEANQSAAGFRFHAAADPGAASTQLDRAITVFCASHWAFGSSSARKRTSPPTYTASGRPSL